MTRIRLSVVGLMALALGLSAACGGVAPASTDTDATAPTAAIATETVSLAVDGMT